MKNKTVGVLGGLGPLSTVYFMEMLVKMTDAQKDQDHLDLIVTSSASTPDRTAYIKGILEQTPLDVLIADAQKLEKAGCDFLVLTCNTAHYFYKDISKAVSIPFLHMPQLALEEASKRVEGLKKIGILATDGALTAGVYEEACKKLDFDFVKPDSQMQALVMSIIYDRVKAGKKADYSDLKKVLTHLKAKGCQAVILGCTELSIIKRDFGPLEDNIVDALESLAHATIIEGGKKPKNTL
ncbi:MAG: aspartate/glutamate racemase family protein [Clostridiales bacterium]|nr:aspartate/glutamate racemase family protein [Clostridiales bacterium]